MKRLAVFAALICGCQDIPIRTVAPIAIASARIDARSLVMEGSGFSGIERVDLFDNAMNKLGRLLIKSAGADSLVAALPSTLAPGLYIAQVSQGQHAARANVTVLQGQAGSQGAQGTQGMQGVQGAQGNPGPNGPMDASAITTGTLSPNHYSAAADLVAEGIFTSATGTGETRVAMTGLGITSTNVGKTGVLTVTTTGGGATNFAISALAPNGGSSYAALVEGTNAQYLAASYFIGYARDTTNYPAGSPTKKVEIKATGSMIFYQYNGVDKTARIDAPTGVGYFNGGTQASGADVAERVPTSETLQPGEVVELDPDRPIAVRRTRKGASASVAGVVSTRPGMTLGEDGNAGALIALRGRVPVRVSAENGNIELGDFLVSGSTPGVAARCKEPSRCVGAIIGKAMERFAPAKASEVGTMTVWVNLQ